MKMQCMESCLVLDTLDKSVFCKGPKDLLSYSCARVIGRTFGVGGRGPFSFLLRPVRFCLMVLLKPWPYCNIFMNFTGGPPPAPSQKSQCSVLALIFDASVI